MMEEKFKIEKGIPIPSRHRVGKLTVLEQMEIGDSVLFPNDRWKDARNQAYRLQPKTYTFRKQKDGYRCWRIA